MDQITKHRVDCAAEELITSIDPEKVCELASSLHPSKSPCRIFSNWKKGSFNVCFPVVFNQDPESMEGEKWMVRIPLLPRLAFPEEKMRSEIATMKYIAEKTTIPIPCLHGYSINSDNILGLPFMLMEYVEGKTLAGIEIQHLEKSTREHLYSQLADVYVQLYHQQFDRVGALTLDENDNNWVFAHNRPISVDINEQEVAGLDFCSRFLPPPQTFTSTIDYIYLIFRIICNDYYRGPDSIMNEGDAQGYRYGIWAGQGIAMEWVRPEYNHGPFILMHGDLRPPNIFIDDNFNITSIVDWEWSHTLPIQMFAVPPYWLTNHEVLELGNASLSSPYTAAALDFAAAVYERLDNYHNPERLPRSKLPLSKLWSKHTDDEVSRSVAYGLLKPHYFGNVYSKTLDRTYYGQDFGERVEAFFQLRIRQPELDIVKQKVVELTRFEKKRQELGIEPRLTLGAPLWPEEEAERLKWLEMGGEEGERLRIEKERDEMMASARELIRRKRELEDLAERPSSWWPLIGCGAVYLGYIISRKRGS